MIWPTNRKKLLTFGGDQVPDTDSGSFFHYPNDCGIGDCIGDFLALLIYTVADLICTTLGKIHNILGANRQISESGLIHKPDSNPG